MAEILIGSASEGVTIAVRDGQSPRQSEGWVEGEVTLKVAAWSGRYAAQFLEDDLHEFAAGLRKIVEAASEPALFSSADGYLDLKLTRDELGRVAVTGEAWDTPRWGTHVEFAFEIDQTYLPPILASLESLLQQFRTVD
jgi:hypothetical protein